MISLVNIIKKSSLSINIDKQKLAKSLSIYDLIL